MSRFQEAGNATDREVRVHMEQPSLDCLVVKARLAFAARLARDRPRQLLAVLHVRLGQQSRRLPSIPCRASRAERTSDFAAGRLWGAAA